ncbi:hypothetical protein NPIL_440481 [Nephila pilipes]|uniref:Uncharacterized protein n=1 Tax=Nephila pilipes TaxID=299642 RepID=A0A8X6P8Y9_NEPPI|nr:hypothetical protein NPIL_440481 [Nephila pilipes]
MVATLPPSPKKRDDVARRTPLGCGLPSFSEGCPLSFSQPVVSGTAPSSQNRESLDSSALAHHGGSFCQCLIYDVRDNQILCLLNAKFGSRSRITINKEWEVRQVLSWEDLKGSRLTIMLHMGRTRKNPCSRPDEEFHLPV